MEGEGRGHGRIIALDPCRHRLCGNSHTFPPFQGIMTIHFDSTASYRNITGMYKPFPRLPHFSLHLERADGPRPPL